MKPRIIVTACRRLSTLPQYASSFPTYTSLVKDGKARASRSILIDHCGADINDDHLHRIADTLDGVSNVYHIERTHRDNLGQTSAGGGRRRQRPAPMQMSSLVEFESSETMKNAVKSAVHIEEMFPINSRTFLCARSQQSRSRASISGSQSRRTQIQHAHVYSASSAQPSITRHSSYADLIRVNTMSEVALRLRFFTLCQLEDIVCSGPFSEYQLLPFGSSIVGLGNDRADLDLVMTRREVVHTQEERKYPTKHKTNQSSDHILFYRGLEVSQRDREETQRALSLIGDIIGYYVPSVSCVQKIPMAMVPIIKFRFDATNVDCDLSLSLGIKQVDALKSDYSGYIMSQMLYTLCKSVPMFPALAIYLKMFAKDRGITSKRPGAGLTSFQLLAMIIFYLQQTNPPLIPPIGELIKSDFALRPQMAQPTSDVDRVLPALITDFFKFYANFDFDGYALNLYDSSIVTKPDFSSLHVINPFNRDKNVCKNVNRRQLNELLRHTRIALDLILAGVETPLSLLFKDRSSSIDSLSVESLLNS